MGTIGRDKPVDMVADALLPHNVFNARVTENSKKAIGI
jgi:hypothetical protein